MLYVVDIHILIRIQKLSIKKELINLNFDLKNLY